MSLDKNLTRAAALPGDLITDHRARLALERRDADERRHAAIAEQSSQLKTPEERIRAWEKLHDLQLPRAAAHPLLKIIATDTQLTVGEVRSEQIRRTHFQKPLPAGAGLSWNAGPIR